MRRLMLIAALLLAGSAAASAQWMTWPPFPRDADLENIVRAAYAGAAAHARANRNAFARDDDFDRLHEAMSISLIRDGFDLVLVSPEPSADLDATRRCAPDGVELRYAVNVFGDGISLAAASSSRVFSYHYEPRENEAVAVQPAGPCL